MIVKILMIVLVLAGLSVPAKIDMENLYSRVGQRIPQFAGPFKIVGKHILPCPVALTGTNAHRLTSFLIKQTREKPDPRFYGNFESLEPFDDTVEGFISMASWNRVSGWVPNAFHLRMRKFCTDLHSFFKMFVELAEKYSSDGKKYCPRGPSNYSIDGAPAHFVPGSKFVAFPYGRWRADLTVQNNNTVKGCFRLFFDSVPLLKESPNKKKNNTAIN